MRGLKFTHRLNYLLAATVLLCCASVAHADEADDAFEVAKSHYNDKWWRKAAEGFDAFRNNYPLHANVPWAAFASGDALMKLGDHEGAEIRFAEFVKAVPDHEYTIYAEFRIAEAALLLGRSDDAYAKMKAFVAKYPDDRLGEHAYPYLGDLALEHNDPVAAHRWYQQSTRKFPTGAMLGKSRFGLGRAFEAQGMHENALRSYELIARQEDSYLRFDAEIHIANLHYSQGRYLDTIDVLQSWLDTPNAANTLQVAGLYRLGLARQKTNDWALAEKALNAAYSEAKLAEDDKHELAPAITFALAETYRRLENPRLETPRLESQRLENQKLATKYYTKVYQTWPTTEWGDVSLYTLVVLAAQRQDRPGAIAQAEEFATRFPESKLKPEVERVWAQALLEEKQYALAAKKLQTIQQGNQQGAPENQGDLFSLARAKLGEGDYTGALATLDLSTNEQFQQTPSSLALRSVALVKLKRYADAIPVLRAYTAATTTSPDNADAQIKLVTALVQTEAWNEAVVAHDNFRQQYSTHNQADATTLYLAENAYTAERRDLAKPLFERLANRNHIGGLSGLAWCEYEVGDFQAAAKSFTKLLTLEQDSEVAAEAAFMLAKCHEKEGRGEVARDHYLQVVQKHPNSKYRSPAMLAAATWQDDLGQDDEAATLLADFIATYPNDPQADAVLYRAVWVQVDLNKSDEANRLLEKLLSEYPESNYWCDAAYRLAERLTVSDAEAADRWLTAVLQRQPSSEIAAHASYLRGQLAAGREDWPATAKLMQELIQQPTDAELTSQARYWLAEALYRQRKFDQAGAVLETLQSEVAEVNEPWVAMSVLRHAQTKAHAKEWEQARKLAANIAARFPEFRQQYEVDYLIGRCWTSQASFDFDAARESYRKVLRNPVGGRTETAAMAQWMIGETYMLQKKYAEAIGAYERVDVKFAYPRWRCMALIQVGKCHEQQERWHDAALVYAKLLKEHPKSPLTKEASTRLSQARRHSEGVSQ